MKDVHFTFRDVVEADSRQRRSPTSPRGNAFEHKFSKLIVNATKYGNWAEKLHAKLTLLGLLTTFIMSCQLLPFQPPATV